MTDAEERAVTRVREFEQARPEAADLARYASLAVRVDSTLLRRLRLHLVPRAEACAEADLWFSDLSESRDGESLVLDPGIAVVLRDRLASEVLPDGTPALDTAFIHTRAVHAWLPASLQLEEELVYVALRDRVGAVEAIERLLRPAIAAMAVNEQRGIEMSRWVLRAMPRMPVIIRDTDAAAAMIMAAIAHIGADGGVLAGLEARAFPADLSWMLPPAALARRTALACEVHANALVFRAPGDKESESLIEVPKTRPIVLELRWTAGGAAGSRIVAVELGTPVVLPASWRQLELRSLSGETYRIERTSPTTPRLANQFEADVFISYAHLDDASIVEGQKGWVTNLHRALDVRLNQMMGKQVPIWGDVKPQGNDVFDDRTMGKQVRIWRDAKLQGNDVFDDSLLERLPRVATFIAVVSPRYLNSEWCQRELNQFLKASGDGLVDGKQRVFKVMRVPVPLERMPSPLQSVLGYEFFTVDPSSGRVKELGLDLSDATSEPRDYYWMRLDDLAHDVADLLTLLDRGASPDRSHPSRTVYLAETTLDVRDTREMIKHELQTQGYTVLPDRPLPLVADECAAFLREQLARSQFSVHLVGQNYGVVPEGASHSIVVLQHEAATARASRGDFHRLIWMPPDLAVTDPRQQAFIESLQSASGRDSLTEVLTTTPEELKDVLLRLHPPSASVENKLEINEIYLICQQHDLEHARSLAGFLFDLGYEVTWPIFDGDEGEMREIHEERLRSCDGALIYYGTGNEAWLRRTIRELQKVAGYGRIKPRPVTGVYVAPPMTPEKEQFRTHEALVMTGGDRPTSEALAPFLESLAGASRNSREK